MAWIQTLYASQPFWIWLILGVALLAIEAMTSTEWLLWPAVSAGVLAMLTSLFRDLGLPVEIGIFAALTVGLTLISRRLIKRVNPSEVPDINDQSLRLIGKEARVVEAFEDGRGRVFVSGSEWPADSQSTVLPVGHRVVVDAVDGPRLRVRSI
ncbi:NfeD family protein [Brevundimonas vesicularis]|uniref:NfeD family protein n=1 Tax=Brevundimonas vesicularis TaxID=41276 RepID=UPI0038D3EB56